LKVTLEKQEKNQVFFEVEIDAQKVTETYEKMFRDVSKDMSIPGFRKGKAPKKLVEKYVRQDLLERDVIDRMITESYSVAIKNLENPIEPIAEPKINVVKFSVNEPMVYKAIVEVRPEVKLGQYKGLELTADPIPEITDEDVEKELENLRKRYGQLITVEDRTVQEGDMVILDIYGEMEGEPIPEGTTDNLSMEVKPGNFVTGFCEELVGMSVETDKTITITFPEDYQVTQLRGKEGIFKVYLKEIKETKLPELNEDFIKMLGEETVDSLKGNIKKQLNFNRNNSQILRKQEVLINNIVENSETEVPESMLQREMYAMWSNNEGALLSQRNVDKEILQASWENWSTREDKIEEAKKRIKSTLVLSEIAKTEKITLTSEEITSEIAAYSRYYNVSPEKLREELIKNDRLIPLMDEILSFKIVNWIEENSKVTIIGEEETVEEPKEEAVQQEETPSEETNA